jgi:xylulokinase
VPYGETAGVWAEEAGLPPGIPIVAGVNDGLGSIVGAAGGVPGRATDPGGAAGGLALCWDRPLAAPGVACWPGLAPNTYIVGGALAAGGRALDWWAAAAGRGDVPATLALAGQAPAGSGGLVFLPFLAGERAPTWDPAARGAFLGLTLDHHAAHLARAVLEGAACALRLLAETVTGAGGRIDELRLCGRQAESVLWNQIKADITGCRAVVPRVTEVALVGDAISAAVGAGVYPDLVTAGEAMVGVAQAFVPYPANRAVYDELLALYRAAYPALRPATKRAH